MECYDVGDTLHGNRIRAIGQEVGGPKIIAKTGRHKAQSVILMEKPKLL